MKSFDVAPFHLYDEEYDETCLGGLETHVLLSYLWSFFCKWLVINVTLVTLKNEVYGIQDQYCFFFKPH